MSKRLVTLKVSMVPERCRDPDALEQIRFDGSYVPPQKPELPDGYSWHSDDIIIKEKPPTWFFRNRDGKMYGKLDYGGGSVPVPACIREQLRKGWSRDD